MISIFSSYLSYANTMLVFAGIIIAVITIVLTLYYNQDKKKLIEKATHNILCKIADDEQMRNDFVSKIVENEKFKQEFKQMMDILADKDKKEKTTISELK